MHYPSVPRSLLLDCIGVSEERRSLVRGGPGVARPTDDGRSSPESPRMGLLLLRRMSGSGAPIYGSTTEYHHCGERQAPRAHTEIIMLRSEVC
ncbi:hypothetical protein PsYK624_060020 [Phanerochaete sordida]|uniref:Uncharacterized protein n=1 Tax=Phanerochaete sordida TaxID=48140 RepID=A0A9P3LC52_9APHY|nr:hypothetical protein PsYK624_060020 [Phanerochaete sordida]